MPLSESIAEPAPDPSICDLVVDQNDLPVSQLPADLAPEDRPPQSDGWTFEAVDVATCDDNQPALALDQDDHPHLHYLWDDRSDPSYRGNETRHATKVGARWIVESLGLPRDHGMRSTMAVGEDSVVQVVWNRIGYYAPPPTVIGRTIGLGGRWVEEEIVATERFSWIPSLAIDDVGTLHLAYDSRWTCQEDIVLCGSIQYATNTGDKWIFEPVDVATQSFMPQIAVDPSGEPRIAYLAGAKAREAWVARHDAAGWHTQKAADVSPESHVLDGRALALEGTMGFVVDDAGASHVFVPGGALVYATDESGEWRSEVLWDPPGFGAYAVSAVIDHRGFMHVTWTVASAECGQGRTSDIEVASGRWGDWVVETVVNRSDPIWEGPGRPRPACHQWPGTTLAIGRQDRLHLTYVDGANRDVMYAVRDGAWGG